MSQPAWKFIEEMRERNKSLNDMIGVNAEKNLKATRRQTWIIGIMMLCAAFAPLIYAGVMYLLN